MDVTGQRRTNWAGNVAFTADVLREPRSLDELADVVRGAASVSVLGRGHSFNETADADVQLSLARLEGAIEVDADAGTVSCPGGATYTDVVAALEPHDVALANLASLTDITVAGAVGTATHGSGVGLGNLATAVEAVELMTADGEVRTFARGDEGLEGVVVHLGVLGVVTRLSLALEPAYEVTQHVLQGLSWDDVEGGLPEMYGAARSVSLFTRWRPEGPGIVWLKARADEPRSAFAERHAGAAMTTETDPVGGDGDVSRFTAQRRPGSWGRRLPHFLPGGASDPELQTELFVPAERADEAVAAMRGIADEIDEALLVSEVRWVAADELWMSPQHGRDTLGIHCTWWRDADVDAPIRAVERALAPFDPRPHWAKLGNATAAEVAAAYPRRDDFVALADDLDPRGVFRNAWARGVVFGG